MPPLQGLAYLYLQQERWPLAAKLLEEALTLSLAGLPDNHVTLAGTRVLLGRALIGAGDAKAAEPHLRKSHEVRLSAYGKDSFRVAAVESALGQCLFRLDRQEEAEALLRPSLERIEKAAGPNHPESRAARRRLAEWCEAASLTAEAQTLRDKDQKAETLAVVRHRLRLDDSATSAGSRFLGHTRTVHRQIP